MSAPTLVRGHHRCGDLLAVVLWTVLYHSIVASVQQCEHRNTEAMSHLPRCAELPVLVYAGRTHQIIPAIEPK